MGEGTCSMESTSTEGAWVMCMCRRVTSLALRAWMVLSSWYSSTATWGRSVTTWVMWERTVSGRNAVTTYFRALKS